eukprot:5072271-Prymnesium_polylepis.1
MRLGVWVYSGECARDHRSADSTARAQRQPAPAGTCCVARRERVTERLVVRQWGTGSDNSQLLSGAAASR